MSKLLVVTCTRAGTLDMFSTRPLYHSLKKQCELNANIDFYVFKENDKGLSLRYNEILKNPLYKEYTVLFVHDDVVLEDIFLYEKLISSPYAITGLAGAKSFNKHADKLAWHLAAEKHAYVGEVAHCNTQGEVWTTQFGPTKSRALILDGLFLSCKVNELVDKELYFDEDFDYHFYDIAFCLRANEKHITSGVLPIRAIHFGLGDSMLTPEWEEAQQKFKTKYCT